MNRWGRSLWRALSSNFGTKVVSVLIALVLWGVVLGSRKVEVTKEIPLEIVTPPGIVPANEVPSKVSFRLYGPKAFLRSILDRREDPIKVNLSGAKPTLVTYRFFSDNIRVPIGVNVLSINPTAIFIKLEYLKRKEVPVRVDIVGTPSQEYRLEGYEVSPETVTVRGAESRVVGLKELQTSPIDISGKTGDFEKELKIDTSQYNVEIEGPAPKAIVKIDPILTNFRIKNVYIRPISSYNAVVDEESVALVVRSTAKDIESLERSKVYAYVELKGRAKGHYRVPVKVKLPKGIELIRVIPERVHVQVK